VTKLVMRHSTSSFLSNDNGNDKSNFLVSYDRRSGDIYNNPYCTKSLYNIVGKQSLAGYENAIEAL